MMMMIVMMELLVVDLTASLVVQSSFPPQTSIMASCSGRCPELMHSISPLGCSVGGGSSLPA